MFLYVLLICYFMSLPLTPRHILLIKRANMNPTANYTQIFQEFLTPFYNNFLVWLLAPHTYYQAIIVGFAIMLAYGLTKLVRHFVLALKEPDGRVKDFSKRWFMRRSGRLIYPAASLIFLAAAYPVAEKLIQHVEIIDAAQRVTFIWLLWVTLKAYVTNTLVRTIGIWMLLPAALLRLFGWFEPTAEYLSTYGFTLGEVEITAYTFVKAIFFISIIVWVGKIASNSGEGYIRNNTTLTRPTKELLIKLFDIVLYAILFLITLNLIGIDLTALAVFGGALGVGLGFGLQKIASNFISGLILLTEKSININNLVEMDDGTFGYVRKLGARASVIETFDGKEVMVPNEDFIISRVANLTHSSSKGRVDVAVGVAYDTDLHKAHTLILEAAQNYEGIINNEEEYAPQCYLREYGDSSVNFLLTFWVKDVSQGRWRQQSDVMFAIWDAFKENGIEIPFPQRDLHIKSGLDAFKKQSKPLKK